MSLFGTNKAILLLTKDRLRLFTGEHEPQQVLFPLEVIRHQEVIDQKRFEKILTDFFTQLKKHEGLIVLGDDVTYQKQLPQAALPEDVQSFYDTIPFPQNQIAKKMIKTAKEIYLLATNHTLYQTVTHIAKQYQWDIKEVLPITIYLPYLQGQEISYKTLSNALQHKTFANTANFLKEEAVENKEKSANSVPLKQYVILIGCVLFLVVALGAAAMNLGLLPNTKPNGPISPTAIPPQSTKPTLPTSTTLAPTEKTQDKKTVSIQIVNGSGITGQASLVKEHLAAIGYTNVQIGSTNSATTSSTIVAFSKSMNSSFVDEIVTELQTLFTTVNSESTASASGYDIFITTGGGVK